ncbi:transposase [uncultured Allobaculum sp.]|uniref:transposase n=1 Tax=uncultured Allobaculum sp. TaxID=1187017 RepID=UPI00258F9AAC|nr:transposase [uncultured Allobaculum sp.]
MGRKSKFSPETKLECVQQYISGVGSGELCKQYGILDPQTITKWVGIYMRDAATGLITPSVNKEYSSELKQKVIAEYRSGQASLSQLCLKYHISAVSVIRDWMKADTISPNKGGTKVANRKKKQSAKSFTKEQKIEAVKWCLENDKDYQKTAHHFGCTYTQIYNWVRKAASQGNEALEDHRGKRKQEADLTNEEMASRRIKQLESENELLRRENLLLKKLEQAERKWYEKWYEGYPKSRTI